MKARTGDFDADDDADDGVMCTSVEDGTPSLFVSAMRDGSDDDIVMRTKAPRTVEMNNRTN